MIVVGDNLKALITQYSIVSHGDSSFDNTSVSLRLDEHIIAINAPENHAVIYGDEIPSDWLNERRIALSDYLTLAPGDSVLGCSFEEVSIPIGYFGFLQTKGSLARLFISIHCCDSQIEPGYRGKITFEIINFSRMTVKIPPRSKVADLFIFKTSTKRVKPYNGRYQNSSKPSIQKPENT